MVWKQRKRWEKEMWSRHQNQGELDHNQQNCSAVESMNGSRRGQCIDDLLFDQKSTGKTSTNVNKVLVGLIQTNTPVL